LSTPHQWQVVFRTLRKNGPIVLVPLAWTFVTAAHYDLVGGRPLLIAHVVMAVILAAFAALSWSEMQAGVLLAWKLVLVVGLGFTLVGIYGLTAGGDAPLWVTVSGWMLLPAAALAYTGRVVGSDEGPSVYTAGAALSVLGWGAYAGAPALPTVAGVPPLLVGLTLVNVGQTAGIVNAVLQY
jgi:hypothetical protein